MSEHARAGRPAEPADLVDVDALLRAYHELRPDPSIPRPAGRLRDVGPPRLGVQGRVQRGAHPRHDRGHLPLPRRPGLRRSAVHRPRHARAVRARLADGPRGAGGERGRRPGRRPRRVHADARGVARDPRREPRPTAAGRPRRRDRRHAVAQPARGRRLQVQPAQRRPGRHRRDALDPGRGEPDPRGVGRRRPRRHHARAVRARASAAGELRLPGRVRRRPRHVVDMAADRRIGSPDRRRPARRRGGRLLGGDRGAVRARPDRHQPQRSTRRSAS